MSRQLTAPTPKVRHISTVVPINKGGTGADNTVDVATQLGAINASTIGVAGGPAKVQAGGTVDPANFPAAYPRGATIDGPTDFFVSATHNLVISNYDAASDSAYAVSATAGTISRSGANITFVAPATPQTVSLTIGTRTVSLNVKASAPITPSIVTPVMNAVNQPAGVTVTSSAIQLPTGAPSHQYSDWELATDVNFVNVYQSSFNDTVNKTSWPISALGTNTTYYLRVRYKDTNQGYSAWSSTSYFTTKTTFAISLEEAKMIASDRQAGDNFGTAVSMSKDGTRVLVGGKLSDGLNSDSGAAYIFLRNTTNNTWTQEAKIQASDGNTSDSFGISAAISGDGTRAIVGASTAVATNRGVAYIYVRNTSTNVWTQEQRIVASDPLNNAVFGIAVSIDGTGTRVAVGASSATAGATTTAGAVYVFTRVTSTWTQEQKVIAGDPIAAGGFGRAVAFDSTATRIVIGATGVNTGGGAYIFTRSGTVWTQEQKYIPTVATASGDAVGIAVAITDAGDRIAVGGYQYTTSSIRAGAVFIVARANVTWTEEATLTALDKAVTDQFGCAVAIDSAGNRVVIGSQLSDPATLSSAGSSYVFARTNTTWAQEAKLIASDNLANAKYGTSVACDQYMTRIASGAPGATAGTATTAGSVYICD